MRVLPRSRHVTPALMHSRVPGTGTGAVRWRGLRADLHPATGPVPGTWSAMQSDRESHTGEGGACGRKTGGEMGLPAPVDVSQHRGMCRRISLKYKKQKVLEIKEPFTTHGLAGEQTGSPFGRAAPGGRGLRRLSDPAGGGDQGDCTAAIAREPPSGKIHRSPAYYPGSGTSRGTPGAPAPGGCPGDCT